MKIQQLDTQRRAVLIDSALQEFATKGYPQASTNTIAKNAGISKALMFHYVTSKEELFQFLVNYCAEKIDSEYTKALDFNEPDLLKRLQHSLLLQVQLLKSHVWLLEFQASFGEKTPFCFETLFGNRDESLFSNRLPSDRCVQLIYFNILGFTTQLVETLKESHWQTFDDAQLKLEIENYFADLRFIFYKNPKSEECPL